MSRAIHIVGLFLLAACGGIDQFAMQGGAPVFSIDPVSQSFFKPARLFSYINDCATPPVITLELAEFYATSPVKSLLIRASGVPGVGSTYQLTDTYNSGTAEGSFQGPVQFEVGYQDVSGVSTYVDYVSKADLTFLSTARRANDRISVEFDVLMRSGRTIRGSLAAPVIQDAQSCASQIP